MNEGSKEKSRNCAENIFDDFFCLLGITYDWESDFSKKKIFFDFLDFWARIRNKFQQFYFIKCLAADIKGVSEVPMFFIFMTHYLWLIIHDS